MSRTSLFMLLVSFFVFVFLFSFFFFLLFLILLIFRRTLLPFIFCLSIFLFLPLLILILFPLLHLLPLFLRFLYFFSLLFVFLPRNNFQKFNSYGTDGRKDQTVGSCTTENTCRELLDLMEYSLSLLGRVHFTIYC